LFYLDEVVKIQTTVGYRKLDSFHDTRTFSYLFT
jgi:hypothetical protein